MQIPEEAVIFITAIQPEEINISAIFIFRASRFTENRRFASNYSSWERLHVYHYSSRKGELLEIELEGEDFLDGDR